MGMDNQVVLTSFVREGEAQVVVLELQAAGIEADLRKDDCGGLYVPTARGVEILVSEADLQQAQEILDRVKRD